MKAEQFLLVNQVDLATGEGLERCLSSLMPLTTVINTAAISSPGACEKDPQAARWGINTVKLV
jgi:dTDP-4-dehydrorhamnose reductase